MNTNVNNLRIKIVNKMISYHMVEQSKLISIHLLGFMLNEVAYCNTNQTEMTAFTTTTILTAIMPVFVLLFDMYTLVLSLICSTSYHENTVRCKTRNRDRKTCE